MDDQVRFSVQETHKVVGYPITNGFKHAEGELKIHNTFQRGTVRILNTGEPAYVTTLVFEIAVKVRDGNEVWNVTVKPRDDYLYISTYYGIYRIVLNVTPCGNTQTSASKTGCQNQEVPPEIGCFKTTLISRHASDYILTFCLYYNEKTNPPQFGFADCMPELLHSTEIDITVPPPQVERPLPRRQITDTLASRHGREIMGNISKLEFRMESCVAFEKGEMMRLIRAASCSLSFQNKSPANDRIIRAVLRTSLAPVHRAEGEFNLAREELDASYELLENVVPGEETALNQYLVAAMLAHKSANTELSVGEKEEAETAFEESFRHWHNQDHNQTNRIPLWASIRELCYRLKTQPQKASQDDLALKDVELERAVALVNRAEERILPSCPVVSRTILLLVISDCLKHEGHVDKAREASTQALNFATTLNLQKEIHHAEERLEKFHQSSVQVIEQGSKVPTSVDDVSERETPKHAPGEDFERCIELRSC